MSVPFGIFHHLERQSRRNRPLRGFATHREANTPSEASAEGTSFEDEMVLARREDAFGGEAADFGGKRTALDAEEVRELLAVERNVELALAALVGKRAEVGKGSNMLAIPKVL